MPDSETRALYDRAAVDYAERFGMASKPDPDLVAFTQALAPGGSVLDFRCAPGRQSALLRDAGFGIDAVDASDGMIATARDRFGLEARKATFDMLDAVDTYDGIWANSSLLHAPRAEMPGHVARRRRALKTGGTRHLGLKLGSGEERGELGRFYSHFSEAELTGWLHAEGFTVARTRKEVAAGMTRKAAPTILILARA